MSKLLYKVMYSDFADFDGAPYVESKVVLKGIVEADIVEDPLLVNRIDLLGFNPNDDPELTGLSTVELSGIASQLAAQTPNEKIAVFSEEQGQWLYANHPEFKPTQQKDI